MELTPIIVFGTGRSGTTLFTRMLAEHPALPWLSGLCEQFPNRPALNRILMQGMRCPIVNHILRRCFEPGEVYTFWEHYCPGFRQPNHDLSTSDVAPAGREKIRQAIRQAIPASQPRPLLKITGWPRVGYMDALFDEPCFIHFIRDGRAVANSLLHVDFWRGREGPEHWRWGPLSPEHNDEWLRHNQSPAVLAAIQWKMHVNAAHQSLATIPSERRLEIRYEELCAQPITVMNRVCDHFGLCRSAHFEKRLRQFTLQNNNYKWQQQLSKKDQQAINDVLGNMEQISLERDA